MNAYKYRQLDFGIYECPTCLDFHLTTKYCNLKRYHRQWLKKLNGEIEHTFDVLMWASQKKAKKPVKKVRPKPPPIEFVPKPPNPNVLPLSKQREILANFEPRVYPQKSGWKLPWWESLRGIIKE